MRVSHAVWGFMLVAVACGGAVDSDGDAPGGGEVGEGGEGSAAGPSSAGEPGAATAGAGGAAPGAAGVTSGAGSAGAPGGDGGKAGQSGSPPGGVGGEISSVGTGGELSSDGGSAGEPSSPGGAVTGPLKPWPPEGCSVVTTREEPTWCELELRCPGFSEPPTVGCLELDDGSWSCSAYNYSGLGDRYQPIQVTGLAGGDVCTSAIRVFITGDDAVFRGEDCTRLEFMNSSDACSLKERCERRAAPGSGVDGELTQTRSLECHGSPLSCTCPNGAQYRLDGIDGLAACQQVSEFCHGVPPEPSGEETCTPGVSNFSTIQEICYAFHYCTRLTAVEPGVSSIYTDEFMSSCDQPEEGRQTSCACGGAGEDYRLSLDEQPSNGEEQCTRLVPYCDTVPELIGAPTCEAGSTDIEVSSDRCRASRRCTQPAVLGDLDLVLAENFWVTCSADGAGFLCQCWESLGDSFSVEAESYEAACSAALSQCPPVFIH